MTDIVDSQTRSRIMSCIKSTKTRSEVAVRRLLHAHGFRFRLHVKGLFGTPDLVLKKYKAAIFVHGRFWHDHDCSYFKWPSSNLEFWKTKIITNQLKDKKAFDTLVASGWRVATIWECAFKKPDVLATTTVKLVH